YELLCGQLPYDVRNLPLTSVTQAIADREPVALALRDRALRGDLDAITAKALRKASGERYASAAALGDDLRRHLAGRPVWARARGVIGRPVRRVCRRPRQTVAAAAALVAAVAIGFAALRLWPDGQRNALILRQARAALASDPTE